MLSPSLPRTSKAAERPPRLGALQGRVASWGNASASSPPATSTYQQQVLLFRKQRGEGGTCNEAMQARIPRRIPGLYRPHGSSRLTLKEKKRSSQKYFFFLSTTANHFLYDTQFKNDLLFGFGTPMTGVTDAHGHPGEEGEVPSPGMLEKPERIITITTTLTAKAPGCSPKPLAELGFRGLTSGEPACHHPHPPAPDTDTQLRSSPPGML
ncbi:hypothetical protein llap_20209 [Limosa lapponica baueri]|uniref:Uncharacterized protein n=1 Tax=Limosa lapponica baueri TaxID=1758121 RepID=A0A2I0T6R2_LIMLA|nr:hypothetical protein llap_20209 [Limosa lapponica baueri]